MIRKGRIYLALHDYSNAAQLLQQGVNILKEKAIGQGFGSCLIDLGKAYAGKKNYAGALNYARQGINWVKPFGATNANLLQEGYELLSDIYHHLGKNDLAYNYLKRYYNIKDSLQNRQLLWRLNIQLFKYKQTTEEVNKKAELGFLMRDNKIKQQQLKNQLAFNKFIFAFLIAFILAGIFVLRTVILKRKNDKLQRNKTEQEWKMRLNC